MGKDQERNSDAPVKAHQVQKADYTINASDIHDVSVTGHRGKQVRSFAFTLCAYGVFLMLIGLAGFLNNPAGAKTALLTGGGFGVIHLFWGWLWNRRMALARVGALASLAVVLAASTWRSWVSWQAFLEGDTAKRAVALLLTAMFLGTLRVFLRLILLWKKSRPIARESAGIS